jgi:hypothetical protein
VKTEAKSKLAPHALMIQSSLSSAMDQVRGIKGEMDVSKDAKKADQLAMKSYKSFIHEMRNDINVARTHERQLMTDARKYPEIANSNELRDMTPALKSLETNLASWESKASTSKYWMNQDQARNDINKIQQQLDNALSKVKSFSSGKLNASLG